MGAEVQDRVAHELAGAVIGEVAAALDLDQVQPRLGEPRRVGGRDVLPRSPPEGDHRQVFDEEQEVVIRRRVPPPAGDGALKREHLPVLATAEVDHPELPLAAHRGSACLLLPPTAYMWIERPSAANAASITASAMLGCACA